MGSLYSGGLIFGILRYLCFVKSLFLSSICDSFSYIDIDRLHAAIRKGEEIMASVSRGEAKVRRHLHRFRG